jgi:hypothetical protein
MHVFLLVGIRNSYEISTLTLNAHFGHRSLWPDDTTVAFSIYDPPRDLELIHQAERAKTRRSRFTASPGVSKDTASKPDSSAKVQPKDELGDSSAKSRSDEASGVPERSKPKSKSEEASDKKSSKQFTKAVRDVEVQEEKDSVEEEEESLSSPLSSSTSTADSENATADRHGLQTVQAVGRMGALKKKAGKQRELRREAKQREQRRQEKELRRQEEDEERKLKFEKKAMEEKITKKIRAEIKAELTAEQMQTQRQKDEELEGYRRSLAARSEGRQISRERQMSVERVSLSVGFLDDANLAGNVDGFGGGLDAGSGSVSPKDQSAQGGQSVQGMEGQARSYSNAVSPKAISPQLHKELRSALRGKDQLRLQLLEVLRTQPALQNAIEEKLTTTLYEMYKNEKILGGSGGSAKGGGSSKGDGKKGFDPKTVTPFRDRSTPADPRKGPNAQDPFEINLWLVF